MATFESILDKPSSAIERPKPLPTGTYICIVKGMPRYDKSSQKQTPFVEFTLQPTTACDDVDADDLEAMGGFVNKTIKATYYLTEDSAWRLKDFLGHCQVEESGTLRQMCEHTAGCEVYATIKHEASNDGQSVFAKLGSTAAVN